MHSISLFSLAPSLSLSELNRTKLLFYVSSSTKPPPPPPLPPPPLSAATLRRHSPSHSLPSTSLTTLEKLNKHKSKVPFFLSLLSAT